MCPARRSLESRICCATRRSRSTTSFSIAIIPDWGPIRQARPAARFSATPSEISPRMRRRSASTRAEILDELGLPASEGRSVDFEIEQRHGAACTWLRSSRYGGSRVEVQIDARNRSRSRREGGSPV